MFGVFPFRGILCILGFNKGIEEKEDSILIEPKEIKYEGFKLSQLNIKELRLKNESSARQRINILPISSHYFSLKMKRKQYLRPGE